MQTAVTAAETATTAAENAKKSATAAGLSADTATQAAKRAETAQASAETSATQADTARQGAETARQQAVTAQNAAKISAAQASVSAQQTTADKTITAGYAKTAKTCADSSAADKQAVQALAEQVTADKAIVADNAAQVAEDRTAAETAAQTAQAVADSLPEDYVTAVAKIAENTAEIANIKITDKELKRRVDALYDIGHGITHKFETDSSTAYAKTIPTGGKLMSVKNIGGRSIVFNQNFQSRKEINNGITATVDSDGTITLNGTVTASYFNFRDVTPEQNKVGKYAFKLLILNNPDDISMKFGFLNRSHSTPKITSGSSAVIYNQTQSEISLGRATGITGFVVGTVFNDVKIKIQIFDLTLMFGAGNEPKTVAEFKAIFPDDYYPYNAGEIVSAGTKEVVEQGKNLLDFNSAKFSMSYRYISDAIPGGKKAVMSLIDKDTSVDVSEISIGFANDVGELDSGVTEYNWILSSSGLNSNNSNLSSVHGKITLCRDVFIYPKTDEALAKLLSRYDIQVELGDTPTAYAPYHSNVYPIPENIRALPGYGWSAGTARNYVDYENKRYVQCVSSVDLGTVTWKIDQGIRWYTYVLPKYLTDKNAMCNKLIYSSNMEVNDESKWINSGAGFFEIYVANVTTSADVAAKMSGVILYYELEKPIVTDISTLIDDDFLRNLTVEAGGSITFKNSNGDDYRIPVPSEEEYVVKLSEVGGTT